MAKRSPEYLMEREHFARHYGISEAQAERDPTFRTYWPVLRRERRRFEHNERLRQQGKPIPRQWAQNLSPRGALARALVEMGWRDESDSWNVGETPKKSKYAAAA